MTVQPLEKTLSLLIKNFERDNPGDRSSITARRLAMQPLSPQVANDLSEKTNYAFRSLEDCYNQLALDNNLEKFDKTFKEAANSMIVSMFQKKNMEKIDKFTGTNISSTPKKLGESVPAHMRSSTPTDESYKYATSAPLNTPGRGQNTSPSSSKGGNRGVKTWP